jgi:hypothetical protein
MKESVIYFEQVLSLKNITKLKYIFIYLTVIELHRLLTLLKNYNRKMFYPYKWYLRYATFLQGLPHKYVLFSTNPVWNIWLFLSQNIWNQFISNNNSNNNGNTRNGELHPECRVTAGPEVGMAKSFELFLNSQVTRYCWTR